MEEIEVSVVMPCLNEEETIGVCINKALKAFQEHSISGEVVVVDNGSTDDSAKIATSLGARVVGQPKKGYGNAYLKGFEEAKGRFIVMGDADDSYDFLDIPRFVEPLRQGYDMVMGTRLKGKIMDGAMPWHHQYIGNPVLTGMLNIFFRSGISDAHCGMRSITKVALKKLNLQTGGMEFASEMVIKASKTRLNIAEIPITLYQDGRSGKPHLRSFKDGWRHLRFMLLHSPTYLFLIPGLALFAPGIFLLVWLLFGTLEIAGHSFSIHTMVFVSLLTLLGFQIMNLGFYTKIYSYAHYGEKDRLILFLTGHLTLERGLMAAVVLLVVGLIPIVGIIYFSFKYQFPLMDRVKEAIFGLTFTVLGIQAIFSSFFFSIMWIGKSPDTNGNRIEN